MVTLVSKTLGYSSRFCSVHMTDGTVTMFSYRCRPETRLFTSLTFNIESSLGHFYESKLVIQVYPQCANLRTIGKIPGKRVFLTTRILIT